MKVIKKVGSMNRVHILVRMHVQTKFFKRCLLETVQGWWIAK